MNILITGASGFIGGFVTSSLAADRDFRIIATGRSITERFRDFENVEYRSMDLGEELPLLKCDVCVHIAGLADDKSSESDLIRANVSACSNLIKSLEGCKCLIFISSSSVYDFSDGGVRKEEDSAFSEKISDYGRTKLMGESVIKESGVPAVYILRPRAVYGPGDRVLLPRILKLVKKWAVILPGSIKSESSMTHVRNLTEGILACIRQQRFGTHIYNLADSTPYRLKNVLAEVAYQKAAHRRLICIPMFLINAILFVNKVFGIRSVLTGQSVDYLNQDSVLSIERALKELAYEPVTGFWESPEVIAEWLDKDG